MSKKIALTSILLSSSVLLSSCDWLDSESHKTPAEITQIPREPLNDNQSSTKSTLGNEKTPGKTFSNNQNKNVPDKDEETTQEYTKIDKKLDIVNNELNGLKEQKSELINESKGSLNETTIQIDNPNLSTDELYVLQSEKAHKELKERELFDKLNKANSRYCELDSINQDNENVDHEDNNTENSIKITPTTSEDINKKITKQDSKSKENHKGFLNWLLSDPLE